MNTDDVKPMWIEQKLGPYWGLILVGIVLIPLAGFLVIANQQGERDWREFMDDTRTQKMLTDELAKESPARPKQ